MLVPEAVQPLVRISAIFLGIQWTDILLYVSTEGLLPKLCPFLLFFNSFPLYPHVACPSVEYFLFSVQYQNSLTSVSRSFRSGSSHFSSTYRTFFSFWCFCFSIFPPGSYSKNNPTFCRHYTFGEGQDNRPPFLCPQVFIQSFYPAALAPGHACETSIKTNSSGASSFSY